MTVLTTSRLRLEPFREDHLEGLHAINSDPEVMKFISGPVASREQTADTIERIKSRWAHCGYSWWAFVDRARHEIVGSGCIQNLRREGADPDLTCPLEIGWRLRRDRWHQGLASEAAIAMTAFAFNTLHADTLYAVCNPANSASESVMKRLGMSHRGIQTWYAQDLTTYEVTRAEWQGRTHP